MTPRINPVHDVVLAAAYADGRLYLEDNPDLGDLRIVVCGPQTRTAALGLYVGAIHITAAAFRHKFYEESLATLRTGQRNARRREGRP